VWDKLTEEDKYKNWLKLYCTGKFVYSDFWLYFNKLFGRKYDYKLICKEIKEQRIDKFKNNLLELQLIDRDAVVLITEDFNQDISTQQTHHTPTEINITLDDIIKNETNITFITDHNKLSSSPDINLLKHMIGDVDYMLIYYKTFYCYTQDKIHKTLNNLLILITNICHTRFHLILNEELQINNFLKIYWKFNDIKSPVSDESHVSDKPIKKFEPVYEFIQVKKKIQGSDTATADGAQLSFDLFTLIFGS